VLLAAEPQVMQQLISGGASVNHRDHDGLSCLAAAVIEGDRRTVALLCAAGADSNAPADAQNNSALEIAAFDAVKDYILFCSWPIKTVQLLLQTRTFGSIFMETCQNYITLCII
jgi:hypothetical protein